MLEYGDIISIIRDVEIWIYWTVKILEYKNIEILKYWNRNVLEYSIFIPTLHLGIIRYGNIRINYMK